MTSLLMLLFALVGAACAGQSVKIMAARDLAISYNTDWVLTSNATALGQSIATAGASGGQLQVQTPGNAYAVTIFGNGPSRGTCEIDGIRFTLDSSAEAVMNSALFSIPVDPSQSHNLTVNFEAGEQMNAILFNLLTDGSGALLGSYAGSYVASAAVVGFGVLLLVLSVIFYRRYRVQLRKDAAPPLPLKSPGLPKSASTPVVLPQIDVAEDPFDDSKQAV